MATIANIVGSPSSPSRTAFIAAHVAEHLARAGHIVESIVLRDLPAEALLRAHTEAPEIARAVAAIARADAIVVATPIYKASFTGLLKTFLDLLPQFGFNDKPVLPLATSGAPAHVLAIDYALRPVLMSLGSPHVEPAWVIMEQGVKKLEDGRYELSPETAAKLDEISDRFTRYLSRR